MAPLVSLSVLQEPSWGAQQAPPGDLSRRMNPGQNYIVLDRVPESSPGYLRGPQGTQRVPKEAPEPNAPPSLSAREKGIHLYPSGPNAKRKREIGREREREREIHDDLGKTVR